MGLKMIIEKIRIKNFKSIGGKWEEYYVGENGLHLIHGVVGSGKSTIMHAITYGLFGKNSNTKGGSKSSIPNSELINEVTNKDMLVEVYLEDYIIRRGLKNDVFQVIDRKDNKNLADKSSKTIDQKWLENTILGGLNYDNYTKIVFLNSKATTIPFLYMTPTQRKDFIEYILDIRILYYIGETIKSKVSETKLDIKDSEYKVNKSQSLLQAEEYKIEQDIIKRKEQETKIKALKEQKQELINDIDKNIKEKQIIINNIENEYQNFILENARKAIEDTNKQIQKFSDKFQELYDLEKKINKVLQKMEIEKDTYYNNLKGFELCGTCPTVKKIVGEFDDNDYQIKLVKYDEKLKEIKVNQDKIKNKIELIKDRLKWQEDNVKKYNEDINKIQQLKNDIQNETTKKEKLSNFEDMKIFEIDYNRKEDLEKVLENDRNNYDIFLNKLDQLERIKKRVLDKSVRSEIFEYYNIILKNKINEILEILFEDDSFSIHVELDELFEIKTFKNGKSINVFGLSESQINRINFSFLFGFQYIISLRSNFPIKLFMIDEILDYSFDSNILNKVLNYLKIISEDKTIIVISHNQNINKEIFDKITTVKLNGKFSEYETY